MKKCTRCGRLLPLSQFHRDKISEAGHYSVCTERRRQYSSDQHGGVAHLLRHSTTEELEQELARRAALARAKTEQT